jgi:ketosteroid isomerase-like protein
MSDIINKGEQLYAALQSGDVEALHRLLSLDFRGELTAGLPHSLGRVYEGLDAMVGEGWSAVDEIFEMGPQVDKLYDGGDVLIGRGWYVGTARSTGKPLRAAFAHFWSYDGERFTGVHQVTDSATWERALT